MSKPKAIELSIDPYIDTEIFQTYGICIPTKTIDLGIKPTDEGDIQIDDEVASRLIRNLHILDSYEGDITILLSTCGGNDYAMMAIYDAIKECKNKVIIKCYGRCFSAGAFILQAADVRLLHPFSRLMIHYGKADEDESKYEVRILDKKYEDVLFNSIIKKNPTFDRKRIKRMLRNDTYISAQKSVELGFADEIIYPKEKK